jgi:hypothetical protein
LGGGARFGSGRSLFGVQGLEGDFKDGL